MNVVLCMDMCMGVHKDYTMDMKYVVNYSDIYLFALEKNFFLPKTHMESVLLFQTN